MTEGRTEGGDQAETGRRLTVPEAAAEIGTTSEGIRSRIKRGTLRSVKEGGTVYVVLGADQPPPHHGPDSDQTTAQTGDRAELVEVLRAQVEDLRARLDRETEANRENRRIIAGLIERVPELEAPREAPGGSESAAAPRSDTYTSPERETGVEVRPWWRRIFGG